MKLSEKLRFLRYSHDYSRAYVAYKLGISNDDYGLLEDGENSLSLSQVEMISELYAIEPAEILEKGELLDQYSKWQDLLEKGAYSDLSEANKCEESLAYLKAELNDIKEILYSLVEKLDAS